MVNKNLLAIIELFGLINAFLENQAVKNKAIVPLNKITINALAEKQETLMSQRKVLPNIVNVSQMSMFSANTVKNIEEETSNKLATLDLTFN